MDDADIRRQVAEIAVPTFSGTAFTEPPNLPEARVAIVTTGGLQRPGERGWERGDQSFTVLERTERDLQVGHVSSNFDRAGAAADLNVVYPIDRLEELSAEGVIGQVAARHLAFMGAQHDTLSTIRLDTGPAAAKLLREDGTDVVLLTPI